MPTARATVHCRAIAAQTAPAICAGEARTRSRYKAAKCATETAKAAMIGMVKMRSGTAILAKATTGTQAIFNSATTTPIASAPSQLSQPMAYSRFCSRVSPSAQGNMRRQCLRTNCEPPNAQRWRWRL